MAVQKTIAIIGATGSMGSAISIALAKNNNNELLLMARDQQKVFKLAEFLKNEYSSTSTLTVQCSKDACWEADIIVLAIPASLKSGFEEIIVTSNLSKWPGTSAMPRCVTVKPNLE